MEKFNEIDCASVKSSLGRFSASETLTVLKGFKAKVIEELAKL